MAKVKFKLSLKELNFEFEGDKDTGEKMQVAISNTLGALTETQNQIMDVEARVINAKQLPSPALNGMSPNGAKSKRKKTASRKDVSETNGESEERGRSRSNKSVLTPLCTQLIREGFFDQKRAVADVKNELSKKGHTFESRGIATGLLNLTRKKYLQRDNSADGGWEYWNGTVDVPEGD